jgi:hypothetical protein
MASQASQMNQMIHPWILRAISASSAPQAFPEFVCSGRQESEEGVSSRFGYSSIYRRSLCCFKDNTDFSPKSISIFH